MKLYTLPKVNTRYFIIENYCGKSNIYFVFKCLRLSSKKKELTNFSIINICFRKYRCLNEESFLWSLHLFFFTCYFL